MWSATAAEVGYNESDSCDGRLKAQPSHRVSRLIEMESKRMSTIWMWGWAAMAIIFLIAELFTTGFFLVCFGIGAAAAALLAYLGVDPFIQVVAFIAVSGVAVLLTRPLTRRLNEQQKNFVGSDRVLEKRAIVLTEINPPLGAGMVRVDAEEWRATSEDGRIIAKDEIVEVLRIEGTRLVVRPSQTDALAEA
jgi:membrane protein implicated in regulation of membrane protease activity